jgi:ATP-dependent Clp endopeptidase proteolytic subunit ClpP
MPDFRERAAAIQRDSRKDWFSIENRADNAARVDIYDEIGMFGTTAADFRAQVRDLQVDRIDLHLNSPGGEVFDAIAILNTLRDHPAKVNVTVDGVAASSASFLAMAGDTVTMARNAELMIHDAWGLAVGNAADMRDLAERLDQVSNNIASIYAERAGGTVEKWRGIMHAETWFSAQEAVDAGLADRVAEPVKVQNSFDLSIFNYAGRSAAPPPPATPETPAASAAGPSEQKEQDSMSDLMSTLRQKLGITDDSADEATILAALDEALAEQIEPQNKAPEPPRDLKKLADAAGAVIVDKGVWDEAQARIQQGVDAARKLREQERDVLLNAAVTDGRIPPASKQTWSDLYDRDPKGTGEVVANLRKNFVPVAEMGYALEAENDLGEYADLFPKGR